MIGNGFRETIVTRMRAEHEVLAARWFERLLQIIPVDARDIFPSESLLDHIPALILEVSAYLGEPEKEAIVSNTAILEKARELGALRYAQRASLHQLLREYQILSAVLVDFLVAELTRVEPTPPPAEAALLVSRLHRAVSALSQSTVESFVTLYSETIEEQGRRLEQFTRMAAHEWRQPLGALQFGVGLLTQEDVDESLARRALDTVRRNVGHLIELTHKLEIIARMHNPDDTPVTQAVAVTTVAGEAARQLREAADARGVEMQIADSLPIVTIDVGRLELIFINLLSNAIKYSDERKPRRLIEILGSEGPAGWCRLQVRDNGIGIPHEALSAIFHRFTRAHASRGEMAHVAGIGLGLSIVEDCVRAIGGRIAVSSTEGVGTTFDLTLPVAPQSAIVQ